RKLSPAALEQPYSSSGELLQGSRSIATELLEKPYGHAGKTCKGSSHAQKSSLAERRTKKTTPFLLHCTCFLVTLLAQRVIENE
ncbi:MAG: hypothetical protein IKC86_09425, partial [Prevotella sp.]|nr:hypothetical protein [Prevotella sp.]